MIKTIAEAIHVPRKSQKSQKVKKKKRKKEKKKKRKKEKKKEQDVGPGPDYLGIVSDVKFFFFSQAIITGFFDRAAVYIWPRSCAHLQLTNHLVFLKFYSVFYNAYSYLYWCVFILIFMWAIW